MRLKSIELSGFKSFAKKTKLEFGTSIVAIVGPNGSGKSNVAESFRFVLGEQSMKSMRGRRGEDMIWNGSPQTPRASRASVALTFDNGDRKLNLDFDEVSIDRVVHRDGVNEYILNSSQVRLRDVAELLTGANIGSTGHHIISQGEADRILSASAKERREMIEDALGLTQFLYKREEAQKKLEKTAENVREVESVRRELMPHLKFLASQVKKIEEAQTLKQTLRDMALEYLKRESVYLESVEAELKESVDAPKRELAEVDARIAHLREELSHKSKKDNESRELMELESALRSAASKRDDISRELGRIEGEMRAQQKLSLVASVPAGEARSFGEEVVRLAEGSKFSEILALARSFLQKISQLTHRSEEDDLEERKQKLESQLRELKNNEEETARAIEHLRGKIESDKDASREAERELFGAMARRGELLGTLAQTKTKEELYRRELEQFKHELGEAAVLVGPEVKDYEDVKISKAEILEEARGGQDDRRRKLERLKIKLEEMGAGNSTEILKEHNETVERDAFLQRELEDLATSAQKLKELINELTETLEERFDSGIEKINEQFNTFFMLMFGGGKAALSVTTEKKLRRGAQEIGQESLDEDDDMEIEEGVDIAINLPHKRIKGLHMLSGGERALTSIALIFAMSQVNPPPFLILDETDAALDEANSRRYGDMIENLSKKSQLILITHNRETMSRAGILYGVTMGSDGVSKLLSVKFEEALAVAK